MVSELRLGTWNRRSGVDITPLVAATLARWGALTTQPLPEPGIF